MLTAKYHILDNVQIWFAYAHDVDLKMILNAFLKDLDEHITLLEKELQKYSIEGPSRPRTHARADVDTQIMSDEQIALNYFTFLQGMIEKVLLAIQYSIYNDNISKFFLKFSSHVLEQTDSILKYLKLKGWLEIPPAYRNVPPNTDEKLDCVEAFHLWTHVNYRYTNIEETLRWVEYVHDIDFRTILDSGLKIMNKQVTMLENKLENFGISTPKRPSKIVKQNQDKSTFFDEYIYKTLFIGIQWAGVFHATAFKHCVTNDRIRLMFKNLLFEEIETARHMIKFGKLKGWLELPPQYMA
ncbi:MAG: DUF3231 family protein [Desulfitobacteriaceae bacterium]